MGPPYLWNGSSHPPGDAFLPAVCSSREPQGQEGPELPSKPQLDCAFFPEGGARCTGTWVSRSVAPGNVGPPQRCPGERGSPAALPRGGSAAAGGWAESSLTLANLLGVLRSPLCSLMSACRRRAVLVTCTCPGCASRSQRHQAVGDATFSSTAQLPLRPLESWWEVSPLSACPARGSCMWLHLICLDPRDPVRHSEHGGQVWGRELTLTFCTALI